MSRSRDGVRMPEAAERRRNVMKLEKKRAYASAVRQRSDITGGGLSVVVVSRRVRQWQVVAQDRRREVVGHPCGQWSSSATDPMP
jgi:hypothetical protein